MSGARRRLGLAAALALAAGTALAGVSVQSLIGAGMSPEFARYAARVSASEGDWTSLNRYGCVGAFQFCPGTFQRYYGGTVDQFRQDPAAQVSAFTRYSTDQWALAQRNGLTSAVGRTVCSGGTCATITESSVLMACQFGCGRGGALDGFVRNGYSCDGPNKTTDGAGTSVCSYLVRGSGFDVAAATGDRAAAGSGGSVACMASLADGAQSLAVPFGADRPRQAGAGRSRESGIGIATAAAGGGAAVYSGHAGTASWQPGGGPGDASVVVSSADGAYRTAYAGLTSLDRGLDAPPPAVASRQVLGGMGTPADGPTGFDFSLAVRQDVLRAAGLSGRAGAAAPSGALAAAALSGAAGGTYYNVNPETYLAGRIPILPSAVQAHPAAFSGRPDTSMTLPTTCSPDPASVVRSPPSSTGTGPSVAGGTAGVAGYRTGGADFAATQAGADRRGLFSDLARIAADDLRLAARGASASADLDSILAHLILGETAKGRAD